MEFFGRNDDLFGFVEILKKKSSRFYLINPHLICSQMNDRYGEV